METVKIGLVGAGVWATQVHIPCIKELPKAEIVAVSAKSEHSARQTARNWGIQKYFTDYNRLLDLDDIDIVDIVLPNYLHAEVALAAAERGKNIICIKPLALSVEEADDMIQAAEKADVKLMYAENILFNPAVERAKRFVEQGAIGSIFRVETTKGVSRPYSEWFWDRAQSGGGALIDIAPHSLSFCDYIVGDKFKRIYAQLGTFVHKDMEVEDTSVLTFEFSNGVIGQAKDSWSTVVKGESRLEIYGDKGRIIIDEGELQPIKVCSEEGLSSHTETATQLPGLSAGCSRYPAEAQYKAGGHYGMMEHFVNCVLNDETPRSSGEEGKYILEIIEKAYESARRGRPIELELRDKAGSGGEVL